MSLSTARQALRFHPCVASTLDRHVGLRMNYSHSIRSPYPYYHNSWIFKKRCLSTGDGEGLRRNGEGALQKHSLPEEKVWDTVVKKLCFRTNYCRDDLVDMWHQFRTIAGNKMYLTRSDFNEMMKRNCCMRDVKTIDLYFRAFDTDHSETIHFEEYVMGHQAMMRVLSDRKANSLLGITTGINIVRNGLDTNLCWHKKPKRVGLVKKWKDHHVTKMANSIAEWLQEKRGLEVIVEDVPDEPDYLPKAERIDEKKIRQQLDFIVCLGGDGTVLKSASYFDDSAPIPPICALAAGTVGFLAPFRVSNARFMIDRVLMAQQEPVACTLRTRLKAELCSPEGEVLRSFFCLNELTISRGPSIVLATIEVYVNGQHITTSQSDGLIVATPSGSTAYNLSAGGCMVSPLVPSILITPIAPHSLSFRPIIACASSNILLRIPLNARADAWQSHDAQCGMKIVRGSYIKLTTSLMPIPMVNEQDHDRDWYQSISDKLHWNLRRIQSSTTNPSSEVLQ